MTKYHNTMSDAEIAALLAEEQRLDQAYGDYYGARHWLHELADAIWLRAEWQIAGRDFMAPADEWDTEQHRRTFVDDCMQDEMHELRRAALDHKGRP
jgi:hypothetical protein